MKIAVSMGDINGVGVEIALKSHEQIKKFCEPIYFINRALLERAAKALNLQIPHDFTCEPCGDDFGIKPGKITKKSGKFSFISFENALLAVQNKRAAALVTLPVNKEAWKKAGAPFIGHTDALAAACKKEAIMTLGCDELFVALYTAHIPLKAVSKAIKAEKLAKFLVNLYKTSGWEKTGVLGFNPHSGDGGAFGGGEEREIARAITLANKKVGKEAFFGPVSPDAAFTPKSLKNCNRLVAMYHDGGLAPLKALYFDKTINVSLNLPLIRTSVGHGTAYDIAYKGFANEKSFVEAVKFAARAAKERKKAKKATKKDNSNLKSNRKEK